MATFITTLHFTEQGIKAILVYAEIERRWNNTPPFDIVAQGRVWLE